MKTILKTVLASSLALSCCAFCPATPLLEVQATEPQSTQTLAEEATLGQLQYSKNALIEVSSEMLRLECFQYTSEQEGFQSKGVSTVETAVNRLAPDATIQVEAMTPGVWVYVQYFTDIDGDGVYEWLCTSEGMPLWDTLLSQGELGAYGTVSDSQRMSLGETRQISAYELLQRGLSAEQNRSPAGNLSLENTLYQNSGNVIFCLTFSDQNYLDLVKQGGMYQSLPSYYLTLDLLGASNGAVVGAYAFEDVSPFDWYYEGVDFVVKKGLFGGVDKTHFGPDDTLTRGMFLQSLYQLAGQPETELLEFSDVKEGIWYHAAVSWATEVGMIQGNSFRPNDNITREELLNLLYQYAKQSHDYAHLREEVGSLIQFSDWRQVSPSYVLAVGWCAGVELIGESSKGSILPHDEASRAEAAEFLKYFIQLQE